MATGGLVFIFFLAGQAHLTKTINKTFVGWHHAFKTSNKVVQQLAGGRAGKRG
jgi:hypothetical protein